MITVTSDRFPHRWLVLAVMLIGAAVALDATSAVVLGPPHQADRATIVLAEPQVSALVAGITVDPAEVQQEAAGHRQPPGLAIVDQALIDGLLLVTVAFWARRRVPRVAHEVVSVAGFLVGGLLAAIALGRLTYLVGMYMSPPYGTLDYLVLFGFFDRAGSMAVLTAVMILKLASCVALFLAGRVPSQKGGPNRIVAALAVTSLLSTVLIAFSYAVVPETLMSMTDAMAGAVVAVAAIVWSVVLFLVPTPQSQP